MDAVYATGDMTGPDEVVFVPEALAHDLAAVHEAMAESRTWGEFRARLTEERREQVQELFENYVEETPPADDEPFDVNGIPGFGEGSFPEWPLRHQEAWMPQDVLDRFGRRERMTLDHDYIGLPAEHVDDIVAALEAHGYRCRRDDDLVTHAHGIRSM